MMHWAPARILERVKSLRRRQFGFSRYPVILQPSSHPVRGRVLLSYLENPLCWANDDHRFDGHSNNWESREIARIFADLNFVVEAINWSDSKFIPSHKYDIVFDIHINLQRLAPIIGEETIKFLHCTGSDPNYQNNAEIARVQSLKIRRNADYSPKRLIKYPNLATESLRIADACSLLGNEYTLGTYPEEFRNKITLIPVSASQLGDCTKSRHELVPKKREFLWFFGGGAVHKGLDRVLEVFARNPVLVLNIVGDLESDAEFQKIYNYELYKLPNVRYHGYLKPNSSRFKKVVRDSFCFIAPSCSEGTSAAAVTCLQVGLFPIVSRDTGITLPAGCGIYLEHCCIEEIERAVFVAYRESDWSLTGQIHQVQSNALHQFSRNSYHEAIERFIVETLEKKGALNVRQH